MLSFAILCSSVEGSFIKPKDELVSKKVVSAAAHARFKDDVIAKQAAAK